MFKRRRTILILLALLILGAAAWGMGLDRAADCALAGGRWNWGGHFCRLDSML